MLIKSCLLILYGFSCVAGHGRLIDPPSRNAMWRFGFPNPKHYTDNELNCGGFSTQWQRNGGKCGACGDPWHVQNKKHEYPGKYCNGIIGKQYVQGEEIEVAVDLTSNHQGWFEYRVGDIGKPPITQAKLKYLLPLVDGGTRFHLPRGSRNAVFRVKLRLPDELTCDNCVLQWWYHCGNNWGCTNGECGNGLNPKQETFINCADIKILPRGGPRPTTRPNPTESPTNPPSKKPTRPIRSTRPPMTARTNPPNPGGKICKATGAWKGNRIIDAWCQQNCPVYYPTTHCKCQ